MNKITWIGDRFECNNPELEDARWRVIHSRQELSDFMKDCELPVWNYVVHLDRSIIVYKPLPDGGLASFEIADEGTGFNVCFNLGAYAIASMNLGQKLEICAYSFKGLLHPLLFQALTKWFGDRRAEEIDKKCSYYSGDYNLKCAVNPSLPCKDCSDASAGFSESLFVWEVTDNIGSLDWASFVVDGVPRRIGIDMGSGQSAVAIATGFTAEDGSIHIDSLEIRDLPPIVEAAIANIRARAEEILDRNFRESYQCRLSDRITPLLPQIGGREMESPAIAARNKIWSQLGGMKIYPQPHRMPTLQELYGVMNANEDIQG